MSTRKQLIDDIELRLYQGKPSDDSELPKAQIAFWIDSIRNALVSTKLNGQKRSKQSLDSFYFEREVNKQLTKEEGTNYNDELTDFRYYLVTTKAIMPLDEGAGIVRINDNFGRNLDPISSENLEYYQCLPYGGTSTTDQAYYKEGDVEIFIEKSTDSTRSTYYYDVVYIPMVGTDTIIDTVEYPIDEELKIVLLDEVEKIARRQMQLGVADLDNDGKDPYHKDQQV